MAERNSEKDMQHHTQPISVVVKYFHTWKKKPIIAAYVCSVPTKKGAYIAAYVLSSTTYETYISNVRTLSVRTLYG